MSQGFCEKCLDFFLRVMTRFSILPPGQHNSFYTIGQCVRRAYLLLLQGSVNRCKCEKTLISTALESTSSLWKREISERK
uniref:Uncharacterized protein n=1 Tax=Ditylenchus dipsaci TaxID=166011 RepID=A0A915E5F8_9BILA